MSLVHKLKSPNATLTWLQAPEGREFIELLVGEANKALKELQTSSDTVKIFRAQGALESLHDFSSLLADIRKYNKDVEDGKIKPKVGE